MSVRETGTLMFYARDFVGVARQSAKEEACLMLFFWGGLAEPFKSQMPYWHPEASLEEYINLALSLSGSAFGMESAPKPGPFREPTESAPEPAPFHEPTGSAPEPAPFLEPTQSAPFREPMQSTPVLEPTPVWEPTDLAPGPAPLWPPALPAPHWHPCLPIPPSPLPLLDIFLF